MQKESPSDKAKDKEEIIYSDSLLFEIKVQSTEASISGEAHKILTLNCDPNSQTTLVQVQPNQSRFLIIILSALQQFCRLEEITAQLALNVVSVCVCGVAFPPANTYA
jgi:nitrogenase subunit NifH